MKLTSHLHVVPSFEMCGAMPPVAHTYTHRGANAAAYFASQSSCLNLPDSRQNRHVLDSVPRSAKPLMTAAP
jgi:hypothetical protein